MSIVAHFEPLDGPGVALAHCQHCHGLLGHLNRTEPSLMLLVTPVLFLLWQVKMSAVKIVQSGSLSRLIGSPKWNRATVNVVSHTCAFLVRQVKISAETTAVTQKMCQNGYCSLIHTLHVNAVSLGYNKSDKRSNKTGRAACLPLWSSSRNIWHKALSCAE